LLTKCAKQVFLFFLCFEFNFYSLILQDSKGFQRKTMKAFAVAGFRAQRFFWFVLPSSQSLTAHGLQPILKIPKK